MSAEYGFNPETYNKNLPDFKFGRELPANLEELLKSKQGFVDLKDAIEAHE